MRDLHDEGAGFLTEVAIRWKSEDNITRIADVYAEYRAHERLLKCLRRTIGRRASWVILGEESLNDPDFDVQSKDVSLIALLDLIDGTDLYVRDLSNWCSAILFYEPDTLSVLAAVIGDAFGRIYSSTRLETGVRCLLPDGEPSADVLPSPETSLREAYVGFYGQKIGRLSQTLVRAPFLQHVKRLYTLGGNPMLLKVADGSMDAVFELIGQPAHDVVAGAFIAEAAGAVVTTLDGHRLADHPSYSEALRFPARKELRYVAACGEELARDIVGGIDAEPLS
jgi:fructose-1,6-bisphosphatase/inositol monophosphatase family enzyme